MTRLAAVLVALAALLAACGGEEGTVTVLQTQTVAAPAESTTATADTAAPESTQAPATSTLSDTQPAQGTTWVAPEATDPAETGPDQFTVGETDTSTETTVEEPPPTSTDEPPAEEEPLDPGVERPADFPTKRENRLLGLLYADIANQCTRTRTEDVTKGANASIYCDIRAGDKVQAWYESFPSVAAMRTAYDRFRAGRDISPNVRSCMPTQRYPAEAPWFIGEDSNTLGRLVCFVETGDVWLVWSDDRYGSLGWAVNRGGKKKVVWDYWRLRGLLGSNDG